MHLGRLNLRKSIPQTEGSQFRRSGPPTLNLGLAILAAALAAALVYSVPASAQGVETVLHARARVFPDVGAGAAKIERDPVSGHYYVLAKPESQIAVYDAKGARVGQVPNAISGAPGSLKYAVDFDVDSTGRLYVADRGDNRIKIYSAQGALESSVFVNAPMSVVALPNGQFAVVTLRTDHLVRVMDEHGKLVRTFGNVNDAIGAKTETSTADEELQGYAAGYNAEYASHTPETYAMNIGKLYGDRAGHIFFAFTALDDPMFRKYDPYGYSVFEATVPAESLIPDIDRGDAHVQLGMNVSGMAGVGNFFSFGTMYSVGGSAGFTVRGGNGGGGGRRGGGPGGGAAAGGTGGGTGNSRFNSSGYSSSDSGSYATGASGLFSTSSDTTTFGGADSNLTFNSSNVSVDSADVDTGALLGVGGNAGLYGATGTNLVLGPTGLAGADDEAGLLGIFGPRGPGGFGGGPGGPGGFHGGPGGPETENHGVPGASGAFIPTPPANGTAAANIAGPGASSLGSSHPGGAAATPSGHPYGGGHGDYSGHGYGHGLDTHSVAAVVKFNQVDPDLRAKPVIHAIAADPASQDVWVTIGDVLLHFDSTGTRQESYLVTTNTGAPLSPVGILVEPDRLLLVGDPTGIYDFARPDKAERGLRTNVTAQTKSSATQAASAVDAPAAAVAGSTTTAVAPGIPARSTSPPQ